MGGDKQWTHLQNPLGHLFNKYMDVNVHNGKVIAVIRTGKTYSWNIENGTNAVPEILSAPNIDIDHWTDKHVFYQTSSTYDDLQLVCMYDPYDVHFNKRCWWIMVFDF